jgi:UDP-hydrolysing UDP-N-acetyl-D-glucosamine 2-epimerase
MTAQKVGIFINSRSEYACLLPVLRYAPYISCRVDPVVILGGEFADVDMDTDWRLHTLVRNHRASHGTMARSSAMMALETSTVVEREAFSKAILVGDRYDTLGAAMTLAYMGVQIFHIQGGEESGNIDESIRHAITKLSHAHLVANEQAAKTVEKLGENPEYIKITGCPSLDLLTAGSQHWAKPGGVNPLHLNDMGVGTSLVDYLPYMVVIYHPETFSKPTELGVFIEALSHFPDHQKIILHPNAEPWSDHILKALKTAVMDGEITSARLISYIEPNLFAHVLRGACCLIGNSSAGIRQSPFIGLPTAVIGGRQRGRMRHHNTVACELTDLKRTIDYLLSWPIGSKHREPCFMYGDGLSAARIWEHVLNLNPPIQKRLHYV